MKIGLVLGGGGLVGMAYHAGALKALDDLGVDPDRFDTIVGTSAGSILGSYLATGWALADFYEYAFGRHPKARERSEDEHAEHNQLFTPMWSTGGERVRRSIGSLFAVASSRGFWRTGGKLPHPQLRRLFPAGMYSTAESRARLQEDLPVAWPDRELFVCAAELYSGARIAFGHSDAPDAPLPDAVLASTAIPGMFPPVQIGSVQYVDGGIVSATSLDLAVEAGCDAIICIAPLGYRNEGGLPEPRLWGPMLVRSLFARSLRREVNDARAKGVHVLVIRPWITELIEQGTNSMRYFDRRAVAESSRDGTTRLLEDNADHPALVALLDGSPSVPRGAARRA